MNLQRTPGTILLFLLALAGLLWGLTRWSRPHLELVDLSFEQLLIANLLGVFFGALIAVETNRWLAEKGRRRRRKEDQKNRYANARRVLKALIEAVESNDKLVGQAIDILSEEPESAVTFVTDPRSIERLLPQLLETTGKTELVRKIDNYRYQLEHFDRKLDAQFELYLRTEFRGPDDDTTASGQTRSIIHRRQRIVDSVLDHGEELRHGAREVLNRIDAAEREVTPNEPHGLAPEK